MKLFNLGNGVENQIGEIKNYVGEVKNANAAKVDYREIRTKFNIMVVGALIGARIEENDKHEFETKGWSKLPNKNQTGELMMIVADFIDNIEPTFLCADAGVDEDMAVIDPLGRNIHDMEKVNNKDFKDMLFKNIYRCLSKEDFQMLALLAERLRKHNMKVVGLWAVGVTVIIAGVAGAYVYHKKQKEKAAEEDESTNENYDDVSDVVITVDDETPVVIVSDDASEVTVLD